MAASITAAWARLKPLNGAWLAACTTRQWKRGRSGKGAETRRPARPRHVILERVNQLVSQYVVEVRQGTAYGEHNPTPERLRNAAGPLPDVAANGIGLLELYRAGVQNQRLAAGQLVLQHSR